MPHFIDCSQKYFQSCRGWQGEIRGKMHNYLFQREFEKTGLCAKRGVGGSWWMTKFVQVFFIRDTPTVAQDISWQMMSSLPCLGRDKGADRRRAGNPVTGHLCSWTHLQDKCMRANLSVGIENLSPRFCVHCFCIRVYAGALRMYACISHATWLVVRLLEGNSTWISKPFAGFVRE